MAEIPKFETGKWILFRLYSLTDKKTFIDNEISRLKKRKPYNSKRISTLYLKQYQVKIDIERVNQKISKNDYEL